MRLYVASARSRGTRRPGHTLTRATRPVKSMPAFGAVADICRCGADRAANASLWRDCPQCTPVLATR